jgi:alkanesulfonate monooxygenase SsuD/methylene tetrahydromethanopterin reductase-like flavin-dependent oxidoreductase (luciferase family)
MKLGFAFVPTLPPEKLVPIAKAVEAAGFDELWMWEDSFKEAGVSSAAIALASTSRITVGIGLLPVPLRNVALTAMEFAVLGRAFPDRFIGGVGHGVQEWMGQAGVRVASPLTLLREYTDALRLLLAGETVTVTGRYVKLDGVKLDWPVEVPLMLGGGGPKSLALTGELGDGSLLSAALTDAQVEDACRVILGAVTHPGPHPIVATTIVATGDGARARVDAEVVRWVAPPEVVVGAAGGAAEIAASILRLAPFGITSVAIQPTEDEPDLFGLIEFLGQEVKPLL